MERTLKTIDIAYNSTGRLVQSIQIMDQLKKLAAISGSVPATQKQYNMTVGTQKMTETVEPHQQVKVFNDKADNQAVIERRLVGQLGDHFQHAQLIELSRNSYLISNSVRLPIVG
jgi:hypothetical protein